MACPNLSKRLTPESTTSVTNACPSQLSGEPVKSLNGPVGILWDIENCPVPTDVRSEDVAGNIRMAVRIHPVIKGVVTLFSAYGDFNIFPRRLREGCQRTGVKLVDVPNGRKDAADKAILVDMFLFALDNPPPSSILLISGDVDFAPALHILGQRGYTIILVIPDKVGVSSALRNAGRFVWDWPSVARGEGFVPADHYFLHGSELAALRGCHVGESTDCPNEEEAIVYSAPPQCTGTSTSTGGSSNPTYSFNATFVKQDASKGLYSTAEHVGRKISNGFPTRTQCVAIESVSTNQSRVPDDVSWVQPGDIQGLKAQLARLLEMSGGSLPLVRVSTEYLKIHGRPLYIAEYGACKLVHLIKKMGNTFTVVGSGQNKMLCLQNAGCRYENTSSSTGKKSCKEKGSTSDGTNINGCQNIGSSSDDLSDDEKAGRVQEDDKDAETAAIGASFDQGGGACLGSFKQEMQELLVCYSCRLLLSSFEALYEQRYKKTLDYRSYGVDRLEDLIAKLSDVVVLKEDKANKRKFLVSC